MRLTSAILSRRDRGYLRLLIGIGGVVAPRMVQVARPHQDQQGKRAEADVNQDVGEVGKHEDSTGPKRERSAARKSGVRAGQMACERIIIVSVRRVGFAAPCPVPMAGEGLNGSEPVERHPRRHVASQLERGIKVETVPG